MFSQADIAIYIVIAIALTVASKANKALDNKGIIFANVIGLISFLLGGLATFSALLFLFVIAESATRISRKNGEKHEQRTILHIIGNTGPAIIFLGFGFVYGFYAAIASSLADTLSSEIGMTSKKKPFLITNLKRVETGTDGGVTLRGILASIFGSAIIAIYTYLIFGQFESALIVFGAGILGSFIDSILGALFERKKILGNTQVNFISTLTAGIIAIAPLIQVGF